MSADIENAAARHNGLVEMSFAVDPKEGTIVSSQGVASGRDPSSGSFMKGDAVANCGHSVDGASLLREVQTGDAADISVPNHALLLARACGEERLSAKRKRGKIQESQKPDCKKAYANSSAPQKPKGVQFPFSVNDHVLIKGNKRTPERFFGREARVTSQCLNGWYLVQTIDGGESIRLQYRSLAKIEDRIDTSLSSHDVDLSSSIKTEGRNSPPMLPDRLKSICSSVSVLVEVEAAETQLQSLDKVVKYRTDKSEEVSKQSSLESDDHYSKGHGKSPSKSTISEAQPSKGSNDLMRIRREMLLLEKLVPWNFLSFSWMDRRVQWRYKVRQSIDIREVATQLHDFRHNLLLHSAGGMSDEEWEKQLTVAIETKDLEQLLTIWRKLNEDVHNLLNYKSVLGLESETSEQLDLVELQAAFPNLQVRGMSPVSIIAATVLASADAIARGEKEAEEILEIPMKLIQQHGHKQLASIREALEREKRHITARLLRLREEEDTKLTNFKNSKGPQKLC